MKISILIKELQEKLAHYGDLDVLNEEEGYGPMHIWDIRILDHYKDDEMNPVEPYRKIVLID